MGSDRSYPQLQSGFLWDFFLLACVMTIRLAYSHYSSDNKLSWLGTTLVHLGMVLPDRSVRLCFPFVQDVCDLLRCEVLPRVEPGILVLIVSSGVPGIGAAFRDHVEVAGARAVGAAIHGRNLYGLEKARIVELVAHGIIGNPIHCPGLLVAV
jgi:hypothetical protein